MRDIIGFIKSYVRDTDKIVLLFCTVFIGLFIWLNYQFALEKTMIASPALIFPETPAMPNTNPTSRPAWIDPSVLPWAVTADMLSPAVAEPLKLPCAEMPLFR